MSVRSSSYWNKKWITRANIQQEPTRAPETEAVESFLLFYAGTWPSHLQILVSLKPLLEQ